MEAAVATEQWKPKYGPWLSAMPTIFAAFMFVLDETIANVALPHMAGSFSASREESTWILTSYLVASGIIIPMVDWLCKLLGRKNLFMISIITFVISSFCCGIANSLGVMVVTRIIQGFGGGALLPIAQAIMMEAFPKEERGKAMAVFGLVIVLAPIIGPVLGGWITDNWSWPWIFFINIPIGFFTLYLAKTYIEDPPYARRQQNVYFDFWGFFFLAIWLVSQQIVLDKGNNADWFNAPWICYLTSVAVISAIVFVILQLKSKNPLVDLTIFKDKNFCIGVVLQTVMMGVVLASLAILPQFLQSLMGYDAFLSGLSMMPRGLGSLTAMVVVATMSNRIDNRILMTVGLSLLGVSGFGLGFLNLQIAPIDIAIPNFLFGFGMGLSMIPVINLTVVTLSNAQQTNASGIQNLMKNLGGAVGTSLVGTLITRYAQIYQGNLVKNLTPLNDAFNARFQMMTGALSQYQSIDVAQYMSQYSLYMQMIQQSTFAGFIQAFRVFGVAVLVVIPLIFLFKHDNKESETK